MVAWLGLVVRAQPAAPTYEVYAVRFARCRPTRSRVSSPAPNAGRAIDIALRCGSCAIRTAARRPGRRRLLSRQVHPAVEAQSTTSSRAMRWQQGSASSLTTVTDIIVSHSHWDHADGVDLFPRAKIWIQKEEYEYYVGANGEVLHRGGVRRRRREDVRCAEGRGRVQLVDGDDREILPGIRVYTGGKHTFASQFVRRRDALRHGRPRVRQRVSLREPREAPRHRADARRGVEPRRAGAHADARRGAALVIPATTRRCSSGFRW